MTYFTLIGYYRSNSYSKALLGIESVKVSNLSAGVKRIL